MKKSIPINLSDQRKKKFVDFVPPPPTTKTSRRGAGGEKSKIKIKINKIKIKKHTCEGDRGITTSLSLRRIDDISCDSMSDLTIEVVIEENIVVGG